MTDNDDTITIKCRFMRVRSWGYGTAKGRPFGLLHNGDPSHYYFSDPTEGFVDPNEWGSSFDSGRARPTKTYEFGKVMAEVAAGKAKIEFAGPLARLGHGLRVLRHRLNGQKAQA